MRHASNLELSASTCKHALWMLWPTAVGQITKFKPGDLIVRYSLLDPRPERKFLQREGLPMLKSTICLCERYLAPAIQGALHVGVVYVIYTDGQTHERVATLVDQSFSTLADRLKLINLDEDDGDQPRMQKVSHLTLDPVNFASVRRTLADSALLPQQNRRLLLGIDISFLAPPHGLILQISKLKERQALYMIDSFPDHDPLILQEHRVYVPYVLSTYHGPQCSGLLGDFLYLGHGLDISIENIQSKISWYAGQPALPSRTSPQSLHLAGFHGIDQFALSLAVGEAVVPAGAQGCFPLPLHKYVHQGGVGRPSLKGIEVIHDKVISSCGAQEFDRCGPAGGDNYVPGKENMTALRPARFPFFQHCSAHPLSFHVYSWEAFVSELVSTLCALEHHVMMIPNHLFHARPSYGIYTNDRSCGPISMVLFQKFRFTSDRLQLINFETDKNPDRVSYTRLAPCIDVRRVGEPVVALEMSLAGPDQDIINLVAELRASFNSSHALGLTLRMMDQAYVHSAGEFVNAVIPFCLCGAHLDLACPAELGNELKFAVWDIG